MCGSRRQVPSRPEAEQFTSDLGTVQAFHAAIVIVETDEGIYGWGESGLSGREKAVAGTLEHFREFLIGRDPMAIGALWQEMYRSQYFEGGRVLTAAMSALDLAFHDIKGKALGVPVYELLGGKQRDHIPTFATVRGPCGPQMIEQAKELMELGWNAIRLFPHGHENPQIFEPRQSIAETAKWCVKTHEALGDEVVLGIDYHHRLSVAEAASYCQKMPSGTLDFKFGTLCGGMLLSDTRFTDWLMTQTNGTLGQPSGNDGGVPLPAWAVGALALGLATGAARKRGAQAAG